VILIADSGSTKTDWRLLSEEGIVSQAKTIGFNPFYQDTDTIYAELVNKLVPQVPEKVTQVYFYGAGCAGEEKCAIVREALHRAFPEAIAEVYSDLVGAARALCGHEPGIACILGTGSNSCLFDGEKIVAHRAPLGFWLGDEGSGGHLGKTLIQQYLLGELPADLVARFDKRYQLGRNGDARLEVLDHAYSQPSPNRYFSSFSKFLFDNRSHPFAYRIIYRSFTEFFEKYLVKYENYRQYRTHFVGSVAFYYSDILRQVANDQGFTVRNILETPIAGLTLYHQRGLEI